MSKQKGSVKKRDKKVKDRVKYITLKDLYLHYRYKWRDIYSKSISLPYFPKDQVSDHEYKLSYKEWKTIVIAYMDEVIKHLALGLIYKIPMGLGYLQLFKYQRTYIDFFAGRKALEEGKIKKGEFIRKKPYELDGYAFTIKWHKGFKHNVKFKNKWLYKISLLSNIYDRIYKEYVQDRSKIYNLSDL